MKKYRPAVALLAFLAGPAMADAHLHDRAAELVRKHILIDTHIDAPYRIREAWQDVTRATTDGEFDLPRARSGGLDIPFMSIYTPAELEARGGSFQLANELIDSVQAMVARAPEELVIVRTAREAQAAFGAGRVGLAMGMENGSPLEHDLAKVAYFRDRGISYITLTHSLSNHIADSSYDDSRPNGGLSEFGRSVILEMNRQGLMVDISHVSDDAFYQVLETSLAPVIASHSSARHFTPGWERNMSDAMIVALAKHGGVIQINFGSTFLSQEARDWHVLYSKARAQFAGERGIDPDSSSVEQFTLDYRAERPFPFAGLDDVLDHFDHVVKLVGIDHVGIGSDYDGVGDSLPVGLKDVSAFPALVAGLLQRGYSDEHIALILGGNLLRVWQQVEDVAKR